MNIMSLLVAPILFTFMQMEKDTQARSPLDAKLVPSTSTGDMQPLAPKGEFVNKVTHVNVKQETF
jgi:mannose/fructose/N-acetylgalactosamine-specific phosphotransferase system component IID